MSDCTHCETGLIAVEIERGVYVAEIAHEIGCTRAKEDQ